MNFILIGILIALIIWITVLIVKIKTSISGFEILLTKFIEVNQEFYEGQKLVHKKDKDLFDGLIKQTTEINIIRKYSTQITLALRNVSEVIKSLKETQKEISTTSDELKTSKEIANSLAIVSNNIKILDKIVSNLQNEINELKRRK